MMRCTPITTDSRNIDRARAGRAHDRIVHDENAVVIFTDAVRGADDRNVVACR